HWAVQRTTGYDFLNRLNSLFVDPDGQHPLQEIYAQCTGRTWHAEEVAYESKKLILDVAMPSELHALARRLERIAEQHRWSQDFTFFCLQTALRVVFASASAWLLALTYYGDRSTSSMYSHSTHPVRL